MNLDVAIQVPLSHFDLEMECHLSSPTLGVYGRSGCGKTSFLETLCGLRREAHGEISVNGRTWLDTKKGIFVPVHQRRVGYVPQGGVLFPDRNVLANLRAGSAVPRFFRPGSRSSESEVIEVLELGKLLSAMPATLSGGEAQRVALGRAICSGAELLLLDEPTASLGKSFRLRVLPFLERVHREFHLPMIVVSHEPLDLKFLCREMIVLSQGRITAHGPPAELLALDDSDQGSPISIFKGVVSQSSRDHSAIRAGGDQGIDIFVAGELGPLHTEAAAFISADEVVLSRTCPELISALNVWPTRLVALHEHITHFTAELDLGQAGTLLAELTHASLARIQLEVGCEVFAIVKAISTASALGKPNTCLARRAPQAPSISLTPLDSAGDASQAGSLGAWRAKVAEPYR